MAPEENAPTENATATEQAAQAPDVATSAPTEAPTAEEQAPAPTETQTEAAVEAPPVADVPQGDPAQLAADGDAVVCGLEENHVNPVTPDESQ